MLFCIANVNTLLYYIRLKFASSSRL